MLSRRHIRIKVMQTLYAYYVSDGSMSKSDAIKELDKSLHALFRLYIHLLSFLLELIHHVELYDDEVKVRNIPSVQEMNANKKFYSNSLATLLQEDENLKSIIEKENIIVDSEQNDLFRKVFMDLKNHETFREYISSNSQAEWEEFDVFNFILKHYPNQFPLVSQFFEEKYLNWYDDSKVAIQLALKTLKKLSENKTNGLELLEVPKNDDESIEFANKALTSVIDNNKELESLIVKRIDKWEPSRVMLIDIVILKMGLAELLYFPSIPTKVTINESIELSKNYSSPNSKKFINGVLDNLLISLTKEGKIQKSGLGLL